MGGTQTSGITLAASSLAKASVSTLSVFTRALAMSFTRRGLATSAWPTRGATWS